jgi:hypothetical protein
MQKLSKLDWRVLFLGFGLGGCFGLATILGMVSLITAGASWYAAIAITIGLLHGIILAVLWRSRERIQLRTGLRLALLASAVGLLTIQFVRHQLEVKDLFRRQLGCRQFSALFILRLGCSTTIIEANSRSAFSRRKVVASCWI